MTFLYALGQRVRWAEDPAHIWRIVYRASHESAAERAIFYGIRPAPPSEGGGIRMADEADLTPWEAPGCSSAITAGGGTPDAP